MSASVLHDRFDVAPGATGWWYEQTGAAGRTKRGMASGLEIAVQLSGNWKQWGHRSGRRVYGRGETHAVSPGEAYELEIAAGETIRQIGFIVYPRELGLIGAADGELVVGAPSEAHDPALSELASELAAGRARGISLATDAEAVLRRYVARRCEVVAVDPLNRARKLLDDYFASDLYLEHVADVAAMKPTTFARAFLRRYGVTPIRYRKNLRVNHAARLLWSRPELGIERIASDSGFSDLSYFYRTFRAMFGLTPAQYRARER